MSWKEDNSLKRIYNTFKRTPKAIFKEDIEALKTLKESLDFYRIKQVTDNILFAKALSLLIIERYKNVKCINSTLQTIDKDLEDTLDYNLQKLSNKITTTELIQYIESLTIEVPHSELNDVDALTKRENEFWSTHEKTIFAEIKSNYEKEKITDSFYKSATEILNNLKNYK